MNIQMLQRHLKVVTFEGLFKSSTFVYTQVHNIVY